MGHKLLRPHLADMRHVQISSFVSGVPLKPGRQNLDLISQPTDETSFAKLRLCSMKLLSPLKSAGNYDALNPELEEQTDFVVGIDWIVCFA